MEIKWKYYPDNAISRLIIGLFFFTISLQDVCAQTFNTAVLQRIAEQAGIVEELRDLPPSTKTTTTTDNGITVVMRTGSGGQVEHIGLLLFGDTIRTMQPSPVYDCIERAALEELLQMEDVMLLRQKIILRKGSWPTLLNLQSTDECSLNTIDDRFYQMEWRQDGQLLLSVVVPIDYELLNGSSRKELEANFVTALTQHVPTKEVTSSPVNSSLLRRYGDTPLLVLPVDTFLTAALTRNTYYKLIQGADTLAAGDADIHIVCDAAYPAETLANLLLATDPSLPVPMLEIELQLANRSVQQVTISLNQWMSFCEAQGCTPYYIFNESDDNTVSGSLLMRNQQQGYNHLLNLSCPVGQLTGREITISGKAYLYIPAVKAEQIYGDSTGKTGRKKYKIADRSTSR